MPQAQHGCPRGPTNRPSAQNNCIACNKLRQCGVAWLHHVQGWRLLEARNVGSCCFCRPDAEAVAPRAPNLHHTCMHKRRALDEHVAIPPSITPARPMHGANRRPFCRRPPAATVAGRPPPYPSFACPVRTCGPHAHPACTCRGHHVLSSVNVSSQGFRTKSIWL